jgi:hypothetical protein
VVSSYVAEGKHVEENSFLSPMQASEMGQIVSRAAKDAITPKP